MRKVILNLHDRFDTRKSGPAPAGEKSPLAPFRKGRLGDLTSLFFLLMVVAVSEKMEVAVRMKKVFMAMGVLMDQVHPQQ